MPDHDGPLDQAGQVISSARAAEHAIQQLCRSTVTRPSMTPAEVDVVLARLAEAVAALPQAARQLGGILAQTKEEHVLEVDTLTEIEDPDLAIDAARLHPDGVGEAALGLHGLLDAAHNETATLPILTSSRSTSKRTHETATRAPGVRRTASHRWEAGDLLWPQAVTPQIGDLGWHGGEPLRGSERHHDGKRLGGYSLRNGRRRTRDLLRS